MWLYHDTEKYGNIKGYPNLVQYFHDFNQLFDCFLLYGIYKYAFTKTKYNLILRSSYFRNFRSSLQYHHLWLTGPCLHGIKKEIHLALSHNR